MSCYKFVEFSRNIDNLARKLRNKLQTNMRFSRVGVFLAIMIHYSIIQQNAPVVKTFLSDFFEGFKERERGIRSAHPDVYVPADRSIQIVPQPL